MLKSILFALTCLSSVIFAFEVLSPDGSVAVNVSADTGLTYSVSMDGESVIEPSALILNLSDGTALGDDVSIESVSNGAVRENWRTNHGRKAVISNDYNRATVFLKENNAPQREYAVEFRVFNDGAAFRYDFGAGFAEEIAVSEDRSEFAFADDFACWPLFFNSYNTMQETVSPKDNLSSITAENIVGLPLTISLDNGKYLSITEAALVDWAGMYLTAPGRAVDLASSGAFTKEDDAKLLECALPADADTIQIVVSPEGDRNFDHVSLAEAGFTKPDGSLVYLSDLKPIKAWQGWGSLQRDKSVDGNGISIHGKAYDKGLGTHASAVIVYGVPDGATGFKALAGIDDEVEGDGKASVKVKTLIREENENLTLLATLSKDHETGLAVQTKAPHVSPWRVIMLGRKAIDLVNSDIVLNLNEPSKIADASWIEPGVSSWNWLSYLNRMDMSILKSFIDLSAEMEWTYALIDDGWYKDGNCTTSQDYLNIPELVKYARSKDVKVMLWLHWQALDARMEEAMALYRSWGVSGLKIDFMSRDDQDMVNWYHKVLECAARNELAIDFHGCYKPTGICRTWPNLLTREAIYGEEQNGGSKQNDPVHKTILPFTRMLAGTMDYTPGSMLNETRESWSGGNPVKTVGTRCQELAICFLYDTNLLCMADKPEHYNTKGAEYLKALPVNWDDTKVLAGEIGEYITTARRQGSDWYLGSITNWDRREVSVSLDFLEEGDYEMTIWRDGRNADTTDATDLVVEKKTVSAMDTVEVQLASGGGFVAKLIKK